MVMLNYQSVSSKFPSFNVGSAQIAACNKKFVPSTRILQSNFIWKTLAMQTKGTDALPVVIGFYSVQSGSWGPVSLHGWTPRWRPLAHPQVCQVPRPHGSRFEGRCKAVFGTYWRMTQEWPKRWTRITKTHYVTSILLVAFKACRNFP